MLLLPLPFRGSNPRVNNVPCMILLERGQELKVECFPGVLLGGIGGKREGKKGGERKKKVGKKRERKRGKRQKERKNKRKKRESNRGEEKERWEKRERRKETEKERKRREGKKERGKEKEKKRKRKREKQRQRERKETRRALHNFYSSPLFFLSLSFFLSFLRFFPFPGRDIWNQFCILTLKAGQLLLALKTRIHLVPFSPAPLVTQYYNILATF